MMRVSKIQNIIVPHIIHFDPEYVNLYWQSHLRKRALKYETKNCRMEGMQKVYICFITWWYNYYLAIIWR